MNDEGTDTAPRKMNERLVELTDATAAAAVGRGLSLVLSTDPTRLCAGRRRGGLLRRRASVEKRGKNVEAGSKKRGSGKYRGNKRRSGEISGVVDLPWIFEGKRGKIVEIN